MEGLFEAIEETNAGEKVHLRLTIGEASIILERHLNTFCLNVEYIDRGFNNCIYVVKTREHEEYVIRLVGSRPRFLKKFKTEGEVAGIHYLLKKCPDIPVPKVLGFCSSRELSGIDAEYILMGKLPGRPLEEVWVSMTTEQKCVVAKQCARILVSMTSLRFNELGSFALSPQHSATHGIGLDMNEVQAEDIQIGTFTELKVGPFSGFLDYFHGRCKKELENLQTSKFMEHQLSNLVRINKFIEVMTDEDRTRLNPEVYTNVPFTFYHGDFHSWNILVDENFDLSGLLDFEFSGALPIDNNYFDGFKFLGPNAPGWQIFDEYPALDEDEDDITPDPTALAPIRDAFAKEVTKLNKDVWSENIPGFMDRRMLHYFANHICPWYLKDVNPQDATTQELRDRETSFRRVNFVWNKYGF